MASYLLFTLATMITLKDTFWAVWQISIGCFGSPQGPTRNCMAATNTMSYEFLLNYMMLQSLILLPAGLGNISSASMSQAVRRVLARLYKGQVESNVPVSDMIPEKEQRNQEIYDRYMAGERAVDLAKEFGISVRRINRIVRRMTKRRGEG